MLIGKNNLNGKPVYLSPEDRLNHMHVLGTTGSGKSKLLEHMIREDIKSGNGLCVIDWTGALFHDLLAYVTRIRKKNVIIIDPNDTEWSVGLNFLEYDPEIRTSTTHAGEVMKSIAKVFGGEHIEAKPQHQRWERDALIPLIERKLTLVELSKFVNPTKSAYRKVVLEEIEHSELVDEWEIFDDSTKQSKESYVSSVLNRANKFSIGNLRRIFGQDYSTIDFRKAMDENAVILVNLAGKLSAEEKEMLGVIIVDKIVQAGLSRSNIDKDECRPFFVYLDEFQHFISDDIATALEELRKFKVFFTLAHQGLYQLKEKNQNVYGAVMNCCHIKISFRIAYEDAELVVKEVFAGKFRGDKVKNTISQTKIDPREARRIIESESYSRSEGKTSSYGSSHTTGVSDGIGEVFIIPENESFFGGNDRITLSNSINSVESTGTTDSYSSGHSSFEGESHSRTEVPFYEYDKFKEVSSITYYSIDEITQKYISWIQTQPDRMAQIKIEQRAAIPIKTPFVESCRVRIKDVERLKLASYSKYALPSKTVDEMITNRRMELENRAIEMGYLESKETPELNAQSMRRPSVNKNTMENSDQAEKVIDLNPQNMRSKK